MMLRPVFNSRKRLFDKDVLEKTHVTLVILVHAVGLLFVGQILTRHILSF